MGLRPRDFWALSLTEWRALCEARFPSPQGLNRYGLEKLCLEHPDV